MGSFPEGFTAPNKISAAARPPSIPGRNRHKIASKCSTYARRSTGPEMFKRRTFFLWPAACIADRIISCSPGSKHKPLRSLPSCPMAHAVTITASVSGRTSPIEIPPAYPSHSAGRLVDSFVCTSVLPLPHSKNFAERFPKKLSFVPFFSGNTPLFFSSTIPSAAA